MDVKLTTIKLSEAMRLGSMLRPQVKWERHNADGTCALGAVEDAVGITRSADDGNGWLVGDYFPLLCELEESPVRGYGRLEKVLCIVAGLNNGGYGKPWTREQIADWIETLEDERAAAKAKKEEAVLACR